MCWCRWRRAALGGTRGRGPLHAVAYCEVGVTQARERLVPVGSTVPISRTCGPARPSRRRSRECPRDGWPDTPCSPRAGRTCRARGRAASSVNWLSTMATTMSPLRADGRLLDHHEIAVENAGVHHRVALHADEHGVRRPLDEVVVDGERVARRRLRPPPACPPAPVSSASGALEEAARRREPAVGRRLDESPRASGARRALRRRTSSAGRAGRRSRHRTAARDAARSSPAATIDRNDRSTWE